MPTNTEDIVWKESNQVKWQGIRPGYYGDQITIYDFVAGGTIALYTVPANKVLLVFTTAVAMYSTAAGVNAGLLQMLDTTPVIVYRIHRLGLSGASLWGEQTKVRFSPLVAPAGYSFQLQSTVAGGSVSGEIEGILVDA